MFIIDDELNRILDEAQSKWDGIVLVNAEDEIVADMDDAGLPADTGNAIDWDTTDVGNLQLPEDLVYDIPVNDTVVGWRCVELEIDYTYGDEWLEELLIGADFNEPVEVVENDEFILESEGTYISLSLVE